MCNDLNVQIHPDTATVFAAEPRLQRYRLALVMSYRYGPLGPSYQEKHLRGHIFNPALQLHAVARDKRPPPSLFYKQYQSRVQAAG